jgi:type VI secretion system secreted protein Hcp
MAVDMFLKIDDIKGESPDKGGHTDEIEIISWNWGMTQSGTMQQGKGGGAGAVNVHDMTLTKFIDAATPNLMKNCCSGKHFKTAILTVRKAGGSQIEYLKITMEGVIISGLHTGGAGSADRLTETVSLNFAKFKTEYKPQKEDGTADAAIEHAYDIGGRV